MLCIALLGDALITFIEMIIFWLEFDLSKQYLYRNITILILAHFGTYVRLQVLGIQACTKKTTHRRFDSRRVAWICMLEENHCTCPTSSIACAWQITCIYSGVGGLERLVDQLIRDTHIPKWPLNHRQHVY